MFRFKSTLLAFATFILLGFAAVSTANADPVVHVTRASFDIAAPTTTTITFGTNTIDYADSITNFPPVTFAGAANHQVGVHTGTNFGLASGNYALVSNSNAGGFNVDNIVITLPSGTHAVGFDLKCGNGTQVPGACAGEYQVFVNGALAATVSSNQFNSFSFIGFTDTEEITTIAIRSLSGGQPIVDNFSSDAAAAAAVPEPATMVLFGTGLAGMASFARKRRRNGSSALGDEDAEELAL